MMQKIGLSVLRATAARAGSTVKPACQNQRLCWSKLRGTRATSPYAAQSRHSGQSRGFSGHSYDQNHDNAGFEAAVWAGRFAGSVIFAAGLAVNVSHSKANRADSSNTEADALRIENWSGLEGLIAGTVEVKARQLLSETHIKKLDPKQLEEAFNAIRKDKKFADGQSLSDIALSREEFSRAMHNLGINHEDVIDNLFDNFDKDGNGSIDYSEWSLAMMALTGHHAKDKLKILFDFCDINGDGKVTRTELKQSLGALFSVASNLTHGKFLNSDVMDNLELTETDVKAAIVHRALTEIFPGPITKDGNEEIRFDQFNMWMQSNSPSAKTFMELFDILGGVMVDKQMLEPARYSGYTFLIGALGKKIRYLAYSSDFGEALRPVVPPMVVNATYAVAIGYCAGDVVMQSYKESQKEDGDAVRTAVHQTVFQAIASIGLPFLIIHSSVHAAQNGFKRFAPQYLRFGPTVAGLALIPFLPMICDHPTEIVIDKVFDQVWPVEKKPSAIAH